MNTYRRTVSEMEMNVEWQEIQAAQRDPSQFKPLYDRYYEPIFRFIQKRTDNLEVSADVCSLVFLKAMQKLDGYSFQGVPFSAWLFRIASNEVAQYYRSAKKNRVVSIESHPLSDMIEEINGGDTEIIRNALIESLEELRPKDLTIIEMRFFEQRPFKEVADILGITESNAKVRTYRVLERLKKLIIKRIPNSEF
ncbi:MAG: sigma-70 family RNA polymerase sigma factor [Bacteroidetes bacterium]|nr:sigma-70 family RNA polymerase sigma factor [Bacteroidota bacterium]MDF1864278.1 sigma-70 family RNA polymerase sigma factor [Saprospiraceae bacterium]